MKVTFTVPGIPVGKGRPRFMKNGHTYTPQKTREYENKVVQCWKCQSGGCAAQSHRHGVLHCAEKHVKEKGRCDGRNAPHQAP